MLTSESEQITELLQKSKTIAVVGLTDGPPRPSYGVSSYMQSQGYRIIPVNPNITQSLGEKAYASLLDVPEKIDIVNIFRRSEFVPEVVEQAIQLKVAGDLDARGCGPRRGRRSRPEGRDFCCHGPLHFERTPPAAGLGSVTTVADR